MRVYQMGPMRHIQNLNFNAFEQGLAYLEWLGHKCVSPHSIDMDEGYVEAVMGTAPHPKTPGALIPTFHNVKLSPHFLMERAMKRDITEVLRSDAISGLPGWRNSEGARLEHDVARGIGLRIFEHTPFQSFVEIT